MNRRLELIAKLNGKGWICRCYGVEAWPTEAFLPTGELCTTCGGLVFFPVGLHTWNNPSAVHAAEFTVDKETWEDLCRMLDFFVYIPTGSCYSTLNDIPVPYGNLTLKVARHPEEDVYATVKLIYRPPKE